MTADHEGLHSSASAASPTGEYLTVLVFSWATAFYLQSRGAPATTSIACTFAAAIMGMTVWWIAHRAPDRNPPELVRRALKAVPVASLSRWSTILMAAAAGLFVVAKAGLPSWVLQRMHSRPPRVSATLLVPAAARSRAAVPDPAPISNRTLTSASTTASAGSAVSQKAAVGASRPEIGETHQKGRTIARALPRRPDPRHAREEAAANLKPRAPLIADRSVAPAASLPRPPATPAVTIDSTAPALSAAVPGMKVTSDNAEAVAASPSKATSTRAQKVIADALVGLIPVYTRSPSASENRDVRLVSNPDPRYPDVALRLGKQGTVVVMATIDTTGRATDVQVVSGSGFLPFDQEALRLVKSAEFLPALEAGIPVCTPTLVQVDFRPPDS